MHNVPGSQRGLTKSRDCRSRSAGCAAVALAHGFLGTRGRRLGGSQCAFEHRRCHHTCRWQAPLPCALLPAALRTQSTKHCWDRHGVDGAGPSAVHAMSEDSCPVTALLDPAPSTPCQSQQSFVLCVRRTPALSLRCWTQRRPRYVSPNIGSPECALRRSWAQTQGPQHQRSAVLGPQRWMRCPGRRS